MKLRSLPLQHFPDRAPWNERSKQLDAALPQLHDELGRGRWQVATDLDGTLFDYPDDPRNAQFDPMAKRGLEAMTRVPNIAGINAITSKRGELTKPFFARTPALQKMRFYTYYGLEVCHFDPRGNFVIEPSPVLLLREDAVREAMAAVDAELHHIGIAYEVETLVGTRNISAPGWTREHAGDHVTMAAALKRLTKALDSAGYELKDRKHWGYFSLSPKLEGLPPAMAHLAWSKRNAAALIRAEHPEDTLLAFGDDSHDLPTVEFVRSLNDGSRFVAVYNPLAERGAGTADKLGSLADYIVDSPASAGLLMLEASRGLALSSPSTPPLPS